MTEAYESADQPAKNALVSRRTLLGGLGATGLLAGIGTLAATPVLAEASPAPSGCRQLITVNTTSSSATVGQLSAWERHDDGGWWPVLGPITCHVGSLGIGAASEGSSRTPAGTFALNVAFGRQPNPGTAMSYFQTDSLDWWDENPTSPTYNEHVRRSTSPGGASEHLYYITPQYEYAVNINSNPSRTPYAGSAIFLHVTDGGPTAGCVSIAESDLVGILRWLRPDHHPYASMRVGAAWTPPRVSLAQAQRFTVAIYRAVLGRDPSTTYLDQRAQQISHGADRAYVTGELVQSDEHYERVVRSAYVAILGRQPSAANLQTRVTALSSGGAYGSQLLTLAAADEAFARAGKDYLRWVQWTLQALVGRPSSAAGAWVARARSQGLQTTVRAMIATAPFGEHQTDLIYRGMLGRGATAAEKSAHRGAMAARGLFDLPGVIAAGSEFWTRAQAGKVTL